MVRVPRTSFRCGPAALAGDGPVSGDQMRGPDGRSAEMAELGAQIFATGPTGSNALLMLLQRLLTLAAAKAAEDGAAESLRELRVLHLAMVCAAVAGSDTEGWQKLVASRYNVSRSDILSERRTAAVVKPRQIAMYLSKVLTLRSLPEIGRRFGGRDHTTVLHAVRKIEKQIGEDAVLGDEVELLKRMLQD